MLDQAFNRTYIKITSSSTLSIQKKLCKQRNHIQPGTLSHDPDGCQNSFAIFHTHHRSSESITFCHYRKKKRGRKKKGKKRKPPKDSLPSFESENLQFLLSNKYYITQMITEILQSLYFV